MKNVDPDLLVMVFCFIGLIVGGMDLLIWRP
jgi:hypothetical protein